MPTAEATADDRALRTALARIEALRLRLEAECGAPVRRIDTHVSWLLIGPHEVWKFKQPLRLPFIDCATVARRRECALEEQRLNARLAPALTLGVVELRDTPAGPVLGPGDGPVVDVAVHMRRFPDGALWSERVAAGRLAPLHVDRFVQQLVALQRRAPVAPPDTDWGTPARLATIVGRTVDGLDAWQRDAPAEAGAVWPALRAWTLAQLAALGTALQARRAAGRVREGHGDLHLANLLVLDGDEVGAFDAIDFDPALRWIDVLHDLAFAVMDLLAHGADALAWRLLNGWLDASGDHDGLPLLRLYLVQRALVRAQVAALAAARGQPTAPGRDAAGYLALGARLAFGADPRLAITHGLPGSGKSVVAQGLLEAGAALRVRSDVERKRLHGLAPLASSRGGPDLYRPEATERTYARLEAIAHAALMAGWPVIVDAAFLRADERRRFAALAGAQRCPFTIVDCRAPQPVLAERLRARQAGGGDPSEADEAVLVRLAAVAEPLTADELAHALVVDAGHEPAPAALARRWRAQH